MIKKHIEDLNRITLEEYKLTKKDEIYIVLDNIRSMHNVGSIFRICDAFLIKKIYICGITPYPPHRDIYKTSLGAEKAVEWSYKSETIELIKDLKNKNYKVISIEQTHNSIPLNNYKISKNEKYCIIFGNEINGISEEIIKVSDICIEIPQYGTKHSLNVSTCVGIVLWQIKN